MGARLVMLVRSEPKLGRLDRMFAAQNSGKKLATRASSPTGSCQRWKNPVDKCSRSHYKPLPYHPTTLGLFFFIGRSLSSSTSRNLKRFYAARKLHPIDAVSKFDHFTLPSQDAQRLRCMARMSFQRFLPRSRRRGGWKLVRDVFGLCISPDPFLFRRCWCEAKFVVWLGRSARRLGTRWAT